MKRNVAEWLLPLIPEHPTFRVHRAARERLRKLSAGITLAQGQRGPIAKDNSSMGNASLSSDKGATRSPDAFRDAEAGKKHHRPGKEAGSKDDVRVI